jgi:hypothetical protein
MSILVHFPGSVITLQKPCHFAKKSLAF